MLRAAMRTVFVGLVGLLLGMASPLAQAESPRVVFFDADLMEFPLEQVTFGFSEPVTVPSSAVTVWSVEAGFISHALVPDQTGSFLTIDILEKVAVDRVFVVLDYSITNEAGEALDGEVLENFVPSGDGRPGGQAVFEILILSGDVDGNGFVDSVDLNAVLVDFGDPGGGPTDLNEDGVVDSDDLNAVLAGFGNGFTVLDGTAPGLVVVTPQPGDPLESDLVEVAAAFTEPVVPELLAPTSVYLIGDDEALHVPSNVQLHGGHIATFIFDTPVPMCGSYEIRLSNAIIDPSGEQLAPPLLAIDGLLPPVAPTVTAPPSPTMDDVILVSGQAPGAASVQINVGVAVTVAPVRSGSFSAEIELAGEGVFTIFCAGTSPCGVTGPPSSIQVVRDVSPPTIQIDFPSPGQEFTAAAIDVIGRVSDDFSGLTGLQVSVNGIAASLEPASQIATFKATDVPLTAGTQDIVIEATDALGNLGSKSVQVTQIVVPKGSSTIEAIAGNGQTAPALTELPEPLEVLLLGPTGMPLVNKVVTFTVDRNDGVLAGDPSSIENGTPQVQVFTDSSGIARAYWRLGSSAGVASDRVIATSQSLVGTAFFTANATSLPASRILVGDMNNQRGETGAPLPMPLIAYVTDGDAGNPVAGVPVTFAVIDNDGVFENGDIEITAPTGPDGRASVPFILGDEPGLNTVRATFDGNPGLPATFRSTGIKRIPGQPTTFSGIVLDNAGRAIGGAQVMMKLTLDFPSGPAMTLVGPVLSDVDGAFVVDASVLPPDALNEDLPGGPATLKVSGVNATTLDGEPITREWMFPFVGYEVVMVPEADNTLPAPVWLPELDPANEVFYDGTKDVVLTVAGLDGVEFKVKAGSLTREVGTVPSPADPEIIRLNQVHFDEVPMPLPNGNAAPFAWTLQPKNATFDPPAEVTLPNMTGLAPGSIVGLLQWNNQVAAFQNIGTGKVSMDGSLINSEPGSGIVVAGWGGWAPPPPPTWEVCQPSDLPDCGDGCEADGPGGGCCPPTLCQRWERQSAFPACGCEPVVCGPNELQVIPQIPLPVLLEAGVLSSLAGVAAFAAQAIEGYTDGEANAYQHIFWQASLVQMTTVKALGLNGVAIARLIGDAHEVQGVQIAPNASNDTIRDLHNNELARQLAEAFPFKLPGEIASEALAGGFPGYPPPVTDATSPPPRDFIPSADNCEFWTPPGTTNGTAGAEGGTLQIGPSIVMTQPGETTSLEVTLIEDGEVVVLDASSLDAAYSMDMTVAQLVVTDGTRQSRSHPGSRPSTSFMLPTTRPRSSVRSQCMWVPQRTRMRTGLTMS